VGRGFFDGEIPHSNELGSSVKHVALAAGETDLGL